MTTKTEVHCINCGADGIVTQTEMKDEVWKYRHSRFKCENCGRMLEQTSMEVYGDNS